MRLIQSINLDSSGGILGGNNNGTSWTVDVEWKSLTMKLTEGKSLPWFSMLWLTHNFFIFFREQYRTSNHREDNYHLKMKDYCF